MYRSHYLRLGWHIRLLQFECHWFYNGIFGVVQIGIIFSSLVVDPLPDKSVTFVSQDKTINRSLIGYFPASISA
jgi:hypothetical protein